MELDNSFPDLLPEERQQLREQAQILTFKTGEGVIQQGNVVDNLMIIRSGQLRVTQSYLDNLSAEFAGPLGPGDVLGEMSFVDGQKTSATLVADGDVEILALPRAAIDALAAADPAFTGRFYRSLFLDLARRLRATNLRVIPQ